MPREFHRSQRVAEELRRVLSEAIRERMDDPRAQLVTLTEVRVSRDLAHARVYFSLLGGDGDDPTGITQALQRAAGFLRGVVGRELSLRQIPELRFEYDDSGQRGSELDELISAAVESDRRKADSSRRED